MWPFLRRQLRGHLHLDTRVQIPLLVGFAHGRHAISLEPEHLAVLCQRRNAKPCRLPGQRLHICLAAEEKDSGVRVSNVYPGEVDTPILEVRPTPVSAEQRQRILQPEDVAEAVLFVATLPPRVSVPELVIKPTSQLYV